MRSVVPVIVLIGLLVGTIPTFAQGRLGRRGNMPAAEDRLKNLSEKLQLSDDQKAKIKPILEDEASQLQQIKKDGSKSRQEKVSKAREIHQAHMDKIRPILTDDQQKKLDEMREEAKERMRSRRQ
ncbi:MAG TPA: hypothetical protein VN577_22415 [Terriglobales bacterium]|nr:hypothetical protein [Terriglobales bacterium]